MDDVDTRQSTPEFADSMLIQLDRRQRAIERCERRGERSGSGTYFEDRALGARHEIDELVDRGSMNKVVLSEFVASAVGRATRRLMVRPRVSGSIAGISGTRQEGTPWIEHGAPRDEGQGMGTARGPVVSDEPPEALRQLGMRRGLRRSCGARKAPGAAQRRRSR